jgi:hypothetical protein
MSYDRERKPRTLFAELEIRTSERTGRAWYSAWLGRCRLIGFEEPMPNERGHRVIKLYVEEAEPRPPRSAQGQQEGRGPPARAAAPSSQAARRDRAERHRDELTDEIPM